MRPLQKFEGESLLEIPFPAPIGFQVIIEPRPPTKQVGSILTAKRTQEADQALVTIGKLLAVGSHAWTGELLDLQGAARPKEGDWVVYRQHSGQRLILKNNGEDADPDGTVLSKFILVMVDTDVLARFNSLADAEKFRSWV
jgi:co-chaperonin GroES (HSP10)